MILTNIVIKASATKKQRGGRDRVDFYRGVFTKILWSVHVVPPFSSGLPNCVVRAERSPRKEFEDYRGAFSSVPEALDAILKKDAEISQAVQAVKWGRSGFGYARFQARGVPEFTEQFLVVRDRETGEHTSRYRGELLTFKTREEAREVCEAHWRNVVVGMIKENKEVESWIS
jgi:hypothetical protein